MSWVALAMAKTAVITTRRVPSVPCEALHWIDVSEAHPEDSQLLSPNLLIWVRERLLNRDPDTVAMCIPLASKFCLRTELTEGASSDKTPVILPARLPAVSKSLWELERNVTKRPKTDVSDSQDVNSQAVLSKRIDVVKLTDPILDPEKIKILVVEDSGGLFKIFTLALV